MPLRPVDAEPMPAMLGSQQPDSISDAGSYGPLGVRAASVRGPDARTDGRPRRDDFGLAVSPDGRWLVAVVADGDPVAPRSHIASSMVVRTAGRWMADLLGQAPVESLPWGDVIARIGSEVLARARTDGGDRAMPPAAAAAMMGTTLALVAVPVVADDDGVRRARALSLGGPAVWIRRREGRWEALAGGSGGPDGRLAAPISLPFLPDGPVAPVVGEIRPGDAVFVLSRGVAATLADPSSGYAEALEVAWKSPPDQHQFTTEVEEADRTSALDRTVVGVWIDGSSDADAKANDADDPIDADDGRYAGADDPTDDLTVEPLPAIDPEADLLPHPVTKPVTKPAADGPSVMRHLTAATAIPTTAGDRGPDRDRDPDEAEAAAGAASDSEPPVGGEWEPPPWEPTAWSPPGSASP